MKTQTTNLKKTLSLAILFLAFLGASYNASAGYYYNRYRATNVINKTAYIIDQAYQIADHYNYWTNNDLSRAEYYNEYAQRLCQNKDFYMAVQYSLRARDYALGVIDGCDAYWDYYYYEYYGWSRTRGYNPNYRYDPYFNGYGNFGWYYNNYYGSYHNHHGNNPYYNDNCPNGFNAPAATEQSSSDRASGRSATFDPNRGSGSSSSSATGFPSTNENNNTGFKNVLRDKYFDSQEKETMSSLPTKETMETSFKKDNRNVNFSNSSLRNKSEIINSNSNLSKNYQATPRGNVVNIKTPTQKQGAVNTSPSELQNTNANKTNSINNRTKSNTNHSNTLNGQQLNNSNNSNQLFRKNTNINTKKIETINRSSNSQNRGTNSNNNFNKQENTRTIQRNQNTNNNQRSVNSNTRTINSTPIRNNSETKTQNTSSNKNSSQNTNLERKSR